MDGIGRGRRGESSLEACRADPAIVHRDSGQVFALASTAVDGGISLSSTAKVVAITTQQRQALPNNGYILIIFPTLNPDGSAILRGIDRRLDGRIVLMPPPSYQPL